MGIEVGTATLIGMMIAGGASAGASVYSAKKQSSTARRAGDMDAAAADKQMAYLRQKDEQERQDKLAADAEAKRQFDETEHRNYDQWAQREQHLAPYRSMGENATVALSKLIGLPLNTSAFAPVPYRSTQGDRATSSPADPALGGGDVPPVPADLSTAITQANKIAYNGQPKHDDPAYWADDWAKDPTYTWKRMLGWQAGGNDIPTGGPFAPSAGAPTKSTTTTPPAMTLMNLIGPPPTTTTSSVPMNNLVRTPALTPEPMSAGIPLRDLLMMDPRRSQYA